jgi:indolepyruvate ferredoxin oxidoreductase beta subunit
MLGAIAGSGVLPIERAVYEEVVRAAGVGGEASLRGFERGHAAVGGEPAALAAPQSIDAGRATVVSPDARREAAAFPEPARETVALGYDRAVAFQDARYGELYIERLRDVDKVERSVDPAGVHGARVLRETARFLALWMAFDDIVRVASLKCTAARFARVQREIGAAPDDVVRIVDHFKPGVPEFAGMLPRALARRLIAWDRRRQARGHEPLAFALHLRTHAIHGFLALRLLASLRRVRRIGARFHEEQRGIRRWLRAVEIACAQDASLGYEIALCGRLIKGYGATNERGKANLAHILEHLVGATSAQPGETRAAAIRAAREAALADEGGKALDAELARHGAPPRPAVAQPIRWAPRRAQSAHPARAH